MTGSGAEEIIKEELIHHLEEDIERLKEQQDEPSETEKPSVMERLKNRVGESRVLKDIEARRGWTTQELKAELSRRQKVLEYLVDNKINDFKAIATIIHAYESTPEKVMEKLGIYWG